MNFEIIFEGEMMSERCECIDHLSGGWIRTYNPSVDNSKPIRYHAEDIRFIREIDKDGK